MTTSPSEAVRCHVSRKKIDSFKWTSAKNIFIDLALLSKYLHTQYLTRFCDSSDPGLRSKERKNNTKQPMFGNVNSSGVMVSSGVKCVSNYGASRLAHYQDQLYDETPNIGSLRRSRRNSNLSGYSIGSQWEMSHASGKRDQTQKMLSDDDFNNNDKHLSSDDVPSNLESNVVKSSKGTEPRSGSKRKNSSRESKPNARSLSMGSAPDNNDRAVMMIHHNRSNADVNEVSPIGTRNDPISRNNPNFRACYFCWCCCCSCSCINVKPKPEESLRSQISNEPQSKLEAISIEEKVTLDDAQRWAQNFDNLMQSTAGRKVFHEFLKLEYSEENIMFYRAVEDLQTESNNELVEEKARAIYEDYISILSPKEVSLDSRVRELINSQMVEPSCHTFDEAQLQIYTLMQRDSYPRFVNSRLYKDFLHQLGGSSNTSNSQSVCETRPNNT